MWPSTHPSPHTDMHPPLLSFGLCHSERLQVLQLTQAKVDTVLQVRAGYAELHVGRGQDPGEWPGWCLGRRPSSLGPGSGEPSVATLNGSLRRPSLAVWRTAPSLGEMDWESPSTRSSLISRVGLCDDSDQQPARPSPAQPRGIRALPSHNH